MPTDWHLVHLGSRALGGAGAGHGRDDRRHAPTGASRPAAPACTSPSTSTAGAASSTSCTSYATAKIGMQLAHAGRKGRDEAAVAAAASRCPSTRRGRSWALAAAVPPRRSGAARDDRGRHGRRCATSSSRAARWARRGRLRHPRAARRARLPARQLPLAAVEPPRRRVRRLAAGPAALSARGARGGARRRGPTTSRSSVRISASATGRRAAPRTRTPSPSRARCTRTAATSSTSRPAAPSPEGAAGRPALPDAVRRARPPRGRRADDDRRQHLVVGRHQQRPRRRARRSVPVGAHAPVRSLLDAPRRLRAGRPARLARIRTTWPDGHAAPE